MTDIEKLQPSLSHLLLQKIKLLEQEVITLRLTIEESGRLFREKQGKRPRRNTIKFIITGVNELPPKKPWTFPAEEGELYMGMATGSLLQCTSKCISARKAISKGEPITALEIYIDAAKSFGSALKLHELEKIHSALAKFRANTRHDVTKETRATAILEWKKKCDPSDKTQEAANKLFGIVLWPDGREVAHRTLVKWIAEEKRKLPGEKSSK